MAIRFFCLPQPKFSKIPSLRFCFSEILEKNFNGKKRNTHSNRCEKSIIRLYIALISFLVPIEGNESTHIFKGCIIPFPNVERVRFKPRYSFVIHWIFLVDKSRQVPSIDPVDVLIESAIEKISSLESSQV